MKKSTQKNYKVMTDEELDELTSSIMKRIRNEEFSSIKTTSRGTYKKRDDNWRLDDKGNKLSIRLHNIRQLETDDLENLVNTGFYDIDDQKFAYNELMKRKDKNNIKEKIVHEKSREAQIKELQEECMKELEVLYESFNNLI